MANVHRPPLNSVAAAKYTGMQRNYLEKLRCTGGGPIFIKRGGMVLYDPDDLDVWLNAGKVASTSALFPKPSLKVRAPIRPSVSRASESERYIMWAGG